MIFVLISQISVLSHPTLQRQHPQINHNLYKDPLPKSLYPDPGPLAD